MNDIEKDIEYIKDLFYKESGVPRSMFEYEKIDKPNKNRLVKLFEHLLAFIRCKFGKHEYEWGGKSWKGYDWYECPHCHKQFRRFMNKYIEL